MFLQAVENELASRADGIAMVRKASRDVLGSGDVRGNDDLNQLEEKWDSVTSLAKKRRALLDEALLKSSEFHQLLNFLIEWLGSIEMKIRVYRALPDEILEVRNAIFEIHEYQSEMQSLQGNYDTTLGLAELIQGKGHPESLATVRHWVKVLTTRWQVKLSNPNRCLPEVDRTSSLRNLFYLPKCRNS